MFGTMTLPAPPLSHLSCISSIFLLCTLGIFLFETLLCFFIVAYPFSRNNCAALLIRLYKKFRKYRNTSKFNTFRRSVSTLFSRVLISP